MSFTDDLTEIVEHHHCSMCAGHAFPQDYDYATLYLNDDQAITAIKQLIAERLPEYEQYDGSRAKTKKALHEITGRTTGHNAALDHVKQNLDLTTKELPDGN